MTTHVPSETTALITGITGQDGWYLALQLRALGVAVTGTTHRREAAADGIVALDLGDSSAVDAMVAALRPDAIYNLAARASSAQLFDDPIATAEANGVAVGRLLEAIRKHSPTTRFCQASSSEVFAGATTSPQVETTPRAPLNAYGAAKAFADHLVAAYRATHGVFACSAILFPHESPRRAAHFLTRKVTQAAARVRTGAQSQLALGDLAAVRDWGYAPDYVEAMRLMLAAAEPRDYVIATGEPHTVGDVCELAFAHVGLDWRAHVSVDPALVRPTEPVRRIGDATRARTELGWRPTLTFPEMIRAMVDAEM